MDISEVVGLSTYLHTLYEERFPPLTPAMCRLWYEALTHVDDTLVTQAVRRWARQHTTLAPSLDQILEQADIVREEEHRRRTKTTTPTKSVTDMLRDQMAQQRDHPVLTTQEVEVFHKLMFLLMERSCSRWRDEHGMEHNKLNLEGRSTQCYEWANKYLPGNPKLAEELQYQGRIYARQLLRQA